MQAEDNSYWQRIPEDSEDTSWSHWLKDRGGSYHSSSYNHWHRSFIQEEEDYRRYQNISSDTRGRWRDDFYEPQTDYAQTDYPEYFTTDGACNQQVSQNVNNSSNEYQGLNNYNVDSFPKSYVYSSYSHDPLSSEVEESRPHVQSFVAERRHSKKFHSSERNESACSSISVPSSKCFGRRSESRNWITSESSKRKTESGSEDKAKKTPFVEKSISNLISKLFSPNNNLLESNIAKKAASSTSSESPSRERRQTANVHNKDKAKSPLKGPMGNVESLKKKDNALNHWKMSMRQRENHKSSVTNAEGRIRHHSSLSDVEKKELQDGKIQKTSPKARRLFNGINGSIPCNMKDYKNLAVQHINFSRAVKSVASKPKCPATPVSVSPKKELSFVSPHSDTASHSDNSEGPPLLSPQKTPKKSETETNSKQNVEYGDKLKESLKDLQLGKKRIKVPLLSETEMMAELNSHKSISKEGLSLIGGASSRHSTSSTFEKISKLHNILNSVMKTSLRDVIRHNIDMSNEASEQSSTSFISKMEVDNQERECNDSEMGEENVKEMDSLSQTCHNSVMPITWNSPRDCTKKSKLLSVENNAETNIVENRVNKARKNFVNSTLKPSCQLAVVTRKQAAIKALIVKQKLKKKRKKFKGGTYDLYLSLLKRKKKKVAAAENQSSSTRDDASNAGTGLSSYSDDSFNTVHSSHTLPEMLLHDDDSIKDINLLEPLNVKNPSVLKSVMKTSLSHVIRESMKVNLESRALSDSELEINKDACKQKIAVCKVGDVFKYLEKAKRAKHSANNFKRANDIMQESENSDNKKNLTLKPEDKIAKMSYEESKLTEGDVTNQEIEQSQDEQEKMSSVKSEEEATSQSEASSLKKEKPEGKNRLSFSKSSTKRPEKRYLRSSFQHERYATIASGVKNRMRIKRKFPEDHFDTVAITFSRARDCDKKRKIIMKKKVITQVSAPKPRPLQQKPSSNNARKAFRSLKVVKDDKSKESVCDEKLEDELQTDEKLYPISMCTCLGKPLDNMSSSSKVIDGLISCQAIDSIDGELVACCNNVSNPNLVRPSLKIPYTAMCEVHLLRLRRHQCCPSCGVFCTQGKFLQCVTSLPMPKSKQQIHFFHQHCQVSRQRGLPPICPHCGNGSGCKVVRLELNNHKNSPLHRFRKNFYLSEDAESKPVSLNNGMINVLQVSPERNLQMQTQLSSDNVSFGPDKFQLQTLLSSLSYEKPLNLRCSGKSLFSTVKSGDVEKVLQLLSMGFDPNHKFVDHHLSTPLHIAASKGWSMIVHILVQYGASLDHVNDMLYTPLMLAVEKKHIDIVQYLIKAGAQLDARGEDGLTCLHVSAKCGSVEICKMLLKTGKIDVNIQDDGGWTSLVWAAEYKNIDVVKLLLNLGADPNIRDNEENTALHWSSFSGNVDICQLFLDVGCELTAVNKHGDTPLHIASRQYSYECVVLFLARGANPETRNIEGETPIMCCVDKDTQTWMALSMNQELKRRRANVKQRGEKIMSQDISRGKERNQIQCVNDIDDEPCPTDFLYVLENCETTPINIDRTITSLQSCQCKDECTSQACTCSSISLKCWYDRDGVLLPDFNTLDPPMVFECNRACLCWQTCKNRVVQKGITCRLQLFRTKHKGWGVRALKDIPKGVFICEYVGEIISDSEADRREDDSYLFDLDNRDGDTYCLDAKFYGNISRFINHHCEPNLVPVKVFVDHQDLCFPRISFFSTKEIKAYEELGFDYGEKFWVVKCKRFLCVCGSPHCKYSKDAIDTTLERYFKQLGEQLAHEQAVES